MFKSIEDLDLNRANEVSEKCIVFYAKWNHESIQLSDSIESYKELNAEKRKFYKVDVDSQSFEGLSFSIEKVPTVLFLNGEIEVNRLEGDFSIEVLKDLIQRN